MDTRMFSARTFKVLSNLPASNTAPRKSLELLSGNSDGTQGANCYQATMQGREIVSIGWRNDRFAISVDNDDRWVDTAKMELWILGG